MISKQKKFYIKLAQISKLPERIHPDEFRKRNEEEWAALIELLKEKSDKEIVNFLKERHATIFTIRYLVDEIHALNKQ